ncbi:hypothetical protein A8990_1734 [Paenibacillus taihuensis]|uniref:Uncharacterized protein n=1 Tax=Paenibacillus taihuensis TaxID=1156355 RepID=A0A3D9Q2W4_9BACL|nr:hypothetical protein [Paenibacillus taihuensis]REE55338.1 hypothetical protein A8990_1734 [Paenibacillus taihuensis]
MKYYLFLIALFLTASGCTNKTEDRDIEISSSSASIGAVIPEQEDMFNQKLTYSIVMKNPDRISVVDKVDVIITKLFKDITWGKVVTTASGNLRWN